MFSEVSSEYAKYRASYAAGAVDKILEGFDGCVQSVSQLTAVVADLEDLVESSEAIYHLAYKTTVFLAQPKT